MGLRGAIDEMKHADKIIERVLFLDGVANLSDYDPIVIGCDVREQLNTGAMTSRAVPPPLRPSRAAAVAPSSRTGRLGSAPGALKEAPCSDFGSAAGSFSRWLPSL